MRTEVMGGQYLDMLEQAAAGRLGGSAIERARRVIHYKSAKYSVEHPLLMGGALAGADQRLQDAYCAFGLPLGEAFQLRDDVLGVFGDPSDTGKPAGDDLREGKRTVLVAATLEAASAPQQALVERLLGDPKLDPAGVDALRAVIVETGALRRVETLIEACVEAARTALAGADLAAPAGEMLDGLVAAATQRAA
jgi:geranylgeranyl diphosphate synthase type I